MAVRKYTIAYGLALHFHGKMLVGSRSLLFNTLFKAVTPCSAGIVPTTPLQKADDDGAVQVEEGDTCRERRLGVPGGALGVWRTPIHCQKPGLAHFLLDCIFHSFEIVGKILRRGPHSITLSGI